MIETDLWNPIAAAQKQLEVDDCLSYSEPRFHSTLWHERRLIAAKGKGHYTQRISPKARIPAAGHGGAAKTASRIHRQFWWEGSKADIRQMVRQCFVCQREKYEATKPPGLLNPLQVPTKPWVDVSMDFIDILPKSEGKLAVHVVVDRLTKYSHFALLPKQCH